MRTEQTIYKVGRVLARNSSRVLGVPRPRLPGLQTGTLALPTFEPTSA
jgi:hypothetical protein